MSHISFPHRFVNFALMFAGRVVVLLVGSMLMGDIADAVAAPGGLGPSFGITPLSASFTVTRSDDRNNASCVPGDCSLREAVHAANANAVDDTIDFASGLINITLTDQIIILNSNTGALAINGPGANILTIGGGAGTNRIFYALSNTVTISGVTLTGGNCDCDGGAIYANEGSLTLDGVHVTGNSASGGGGGVRFVGGTHLIRNSTISGNTAQICGGFESAYFALTTIVNSTISGNTAEGGGGFCNTVSTLTVINTTISGNTASYGGTGFWGGGGFIDFGVITTLRNVTITNNTAPFGGGIFQDYYEIGDGVTRVPSRLNLGNTIVAGNTSINGIDPEIYNYAGISITTSEGGNLIGDSPGDSSPTIVYQPTDIRDTNPLLGPLQNNGGTTPTHALLAGSPIIDRGLNGLANALMLNNDQRGTGFARIRDGDSDGAARVDIGAFEVQLGSTATTTTPFDFDGDGKADLSVFRPSVGEWYYQQSSSGVPRGFGFGTSTDKVATADFTGDGKTDIAFWRPSTGEWYVLRSEDSTYFAFPFGTNGDIPAPADFDGDRKADAAVYRPSAQTWFILRSSNGGVDSVPFGISTDVPEPADYDGDGKTDVGIYRPSQGQWWYLRSSNQSVFAATFGSSTDKPVPGDYTGDGKADIAFYRPSEGNWYVIRSEDFSYFAFPFGNSTDKPAPADYDGDGKFDAAVFRPSDTNWYILKSTGGVQIQHFGLANDIPLPGAFVP